VAGQENGRIGRTGENDPKAIGLSDYSVFLPWPPKELSPNYRGHWAKVAQVKRTYRQACWALAREAGLGPGTLAGAKRAELILLFFPPNRQPRDHDNLIAAMKAGIDGLADAMKVDDRIFTITSTVVDSIGGMVRAVVKPHLD